MRRVIRSTSSARRLERAATWLRERAGSGALVLAPTRRAADDLARRVAAEAGHLLGVHRAASGQLARTLAAEILAERGLVAVSPLGRRALAARAIFAVARTHRLEYFAPIHRTPGFPKAVARTLLELRLAGLEPEDLEQSPHPGASDLAKLSRAYEAVLSESGLTDEAGVLASATQAALTLARPPLGLPLLLVDAPPRSTLELQFLRALAQRAPELAVTLHRGDTVGLEWTRALLGESFETLTEEEPDDRAVARVRRRLFATATPSDEPPRPEPEADGGFELFSASSEAEECIEIARRILWLGREGHRFDEMAVFLRSPELHGPHLRDAFRRAGVPAFFTEEIERPDPAGRALLALLECAIEGLSATRFAEYLSLGQAPALSSDAEDEARARPPRVPWVAARDLSQLVFQTEVMDPSPSPAPRLAPDASAPAHWERLLVDASVIGDRARWARRLSGLEEELQLRIRGLDPSEPGRQALERQVQGLRRLRSFALPLIEFLASLPAQASWGAWLDFLGELAVLALVVPESVLATLAELRPMARVGPVGLFEVREVLREELGAHRPAPEVRDRRFGRVFVGHIDEAAGRSFERVFLPGLAEGSFPRKAEEDPLLLDVARQDLGARLELMSDRTHAERLRLHLAVAAARLELVASFPRLDRAAGRARVPSFYALELLRAAEGALPDLRSLETRALAGAEGRLGWPAPASPERAIDETEHDLAVLAELLERPRSESVGRARYLLDCNPHLGRSLRAQARRWLPAWRAVDGLVDPGPEARARLAGYRLEAMSYAPRALEDFAACPYRFFLHALMRLSPRPSRARLEALDPLTRASILREVRARVLAELHTLPQALGSERLEAALGTTDRALGEVAADYEERLAPPIPQVWRGTLEDLRADLRGWVRELLVHDRGDLPAPGAVSFGGASEAPTRVLRGYRVHGEVELLERDPAGAALWAVDTASGRPPARPARSVGGGATLRPVLNALALEAARGWVMAGGRTQYATQKGGYQRLDIPLTEGARRAAARALETIDRAVEDGFFPQAPRRGACETCRYRMVCGPHEEERSARKDKRRLDALTRLRRLD